MKKKSPTISKKKTPVASKAKTVREIPIYDMHGKTKGNLELPKEIFLIEKNPKLLSQYVRVYLANQRQGNASTKTQSEVTGSTRKIYRQKGTGRARHGSIKAPIFVGGGIVGGPRPKDFSLKLNKKQKKLALFYSLSLKDKENGIIALDERFLSMEPKTKLFVQFLNTSQLKSASLLLVLPEMGKSRSLILASRNIKGIDFTDANSLNAYDVLTHAKILLWKESLLKLGSHSQKSK
ncbi:50S ribosomal protein L4 [Candidatus Roizmanbacteria bacterium CG09_land_8_20_14_0_10_41_9]|uniref:Large ribosomal subunit protein uL4 n=1 Tax=Candidatus Roizmanbacteria bacterium CG09_land_8_20_14_0_10_41_9 TaxID=1974850 RepID=A0A2H0WT16_9BACT|nr:MAG: 50S ribosomal protein L4 [Candidatus Roizmanbacteria bacterium CG09_land_8_20_14_0_10_41_9]